MDEENCYDDESDDEEQMDQYTRGFDQYQQGKDYSGRALNKPGMTKHYKPKGGNMKPGEMIDDDDLDYKFQMYKQ